jgi:hypothetical protein
MIMKPDKFKHTNAYISHVCLFKCIANRVQNYCTNIALGAASFYRCPFCLEFVADKVNLSLVCIQLRLFQIFSSIIKDVIPSMCYY